MTIWFATGNIHKKKELAEIFASVRGAKDFTVRMPADAGLAFDPEETGNSFFDNALLKARALRRILEEKRPPLYTPDDAVVADDSGLCVDALGGRPGIHSARYGGRELPQTEKNAMLLAEFAENAPGGASRSARFVCAMILYYSADRFFAAQETMEGELVKTTEDVKGKGGFGYDPVLYIPGLGRTVAELSDAEKNLHSHRGKAAAVTGRVLW